MLSRKEYQKLYRIKNKHRWKKYYAALKEKRKHYSRAKKQAISAQRKLYNKTHRLEISKQQNEKRVYNKLNGVGYESSLKYKLSMWKRGAKWRGKTWDSDLTLEYLQSLPMVCYYTGMDLTTSPRKSNTVSLDRVDSSKGYSRENVVLCCASVNIMKRDMPKDEFLKLCNLISTRHFV